MISRLFQYCLACGMPARKVQRLIGETYTLMKEEPGTELRDASEYSTLLNATARYEYSDIGLAVCMGDRGEAFHTARDLLDVHRRNLVNGLNYVSDRGVIRMANMQYFDAKSEIRETIVGIIAGMSTSLACVTRGVPDHRAGDLRAGDQGLGPGQPRPDRPGPEPRESHRRGGGGGGRRRRRPRHRRGRHHTGGQGTGVPGTA